MRIHLAAAAVAAAGLLLLGAPPAVAGNVSTYTGSCHLSATEDTTGTVLQPDTWLGTVHANVAMTSTDPNDVPVQGTVTCELKVNGVLKQSPSFSGSAVVVGTEVASYIATANDVVEMCTVVDYTGPFDTTPTATSCVVVTWPPTVHSPVVGAVYVVGHLLAGQPTFLATGDLGNPAWWTCTDNGSATPYQVTCLPQSSTVLDWYCDVLHAEVFTALPGSVARTSLDCNGGGPEAQTATVSGNGGNDAVASTSAVAVTAFTCTLDDGANGAAVPIFIGVCGA